MVPREEVAPIHVRSKHQGSWTILDVDGDVDVTTSPSLRARVLATADQDRPRVIVDLADVSYIDAVGFGALVAGLEAAREHDGTLSVVAPGGPARRALGLMGMDSVIEVHDSIADALGGPAPA